MVIRILLASLSAALFCSACFHSYAPGDTAELSGRGYVHYHLYPDTGQCYCGIAYPFTLHRKMIAAASESIHAHFGGDMCAHPKYVDLVSTRTGRSIRVLIVDKGGQPTDDFNREEQHIMDISAEAFDSLDVDGEGRFSGRLYVGWEINSAEP